MYFRCTNGRKAVSTVEETDKKKKTRACKNSLHKWNQVKNERRRAFPSPASTLSSDLLLYLPERGKAPGKGGGNSVQKLTLAKTWQSQELESRSDRKPGTWKRKKKEGKRDQVSKFSPPPSEARKATHSSHPTQPHPFVHLNDPGEIRFSGRELENLPSSGMGT